MTDHDYPHNLSPLDLLEQKSRKLATELSDDDDEDVKVYHPLQRLARPNQVEVDNSIPEWRPSSRGSIESVSSFGGGILDSLRLSSIADLARETHQNYRDSRVLNEPSPRKPNSLSVRYSEVPAQVLSPESRMLNDLRVSRIEASGESIFQDGSKPQTEQPKTDSSHLNRHSVDSTHLQSFKAKCGIDRTGDNARTRVSMPPAPRQQFVPPTSTSGASFLKGQLSRRNSHGGVPSNSKANLVVPKLGSGSSPNLEVGAWIASPRPGQSPHATGLSPKSRSVSGGNTLPEKKFADMTLEEHVALGISLHEAGDLRESSYHWQYAANKGDYTAMLLYGLAVRHGWGVRQNPADAIKWLQKAMEESSQEEESLIDGYRKSAMFTDDIDVEKPQHVRQKSTDNAASKNPQLKKAQIGLALYELGMSYLHSWGIEKDEAMALKSFEMAGELGDCDALCEAAALYMRSGKGRKKDLQKAARLYREAVARGTNMVGNSWIYKEKYMKGEDGKKEKEKKKEKDKKK